jgi:hypothetical protein
MKTLIAFGLGALLTSCLCNECKAQPTVTTFVNSYGQPVATIQQVGNTTFVSNQYGQLVGSATTLPIPVPVQLQNVLPILPTLPMLGAPR